MAIVRGQFTHLFAGKLLFLDDGDYHHLVEFVELQEELMIVYPDTSKIPIWRRRSTRLEHPIEAWRIWGLQKGDNYDRMNSVSEPPAAWRLTSAAADCVWEGPVLRAHKRPVDPKYWDELRPIKHERYEEYAEAMRDTFECAGVWAVLNRPAAEQLARDYSVSCFGRVHLWGRVAQFQQGYRAEACMIKELWLMRTIYGMFNTRNDQRDLISAKSKHDIPKMLHKKVLELAQDLERVYGVEVHLL